MTEPVVLDVRRVVDEFRHLEARYLVAQTANDDILLRLDYMVDISIQLWLDGVVDDDQLGKAIINSIKIAHEIGRRYGNGEIEGNGYPVGDSGHNSGV
jgi:hypothetical protein